MTDADDNQSTASDSTDASILTVIENNQSSVTALPEDFVNTDYDHTPKQSVEPNLLGLSSCEGHVNTPLQTLDGQYMNQPSHFLPSKNGTRSKKVSPEN